MKKLVSRNLVKFTRFYSKTNANIMAGFAGESQANRKYLAFSEKAEKEGFKNVAKLFKAASQAEAIHAKFLLEKSSIFKTTEENLKNAIEGETYEYTEMYPEFIKIAKEEKRNDVVPQFTMAMKAEMVHAKLYSEALESVKQGKDLSTSRFYLCPKCGNIELFSPDKCSICGLAGDKFEIIE